MKKLTVAELEEMLRTLPSDYEISFVDENSGAQLHLMEAMATRHSTSKQPGEYLISLSGRAA